MRRADDGEAGRLHGGGESKEGAVSGHGGPTLTGNVETRTAEQRLSLSSTLGAASERRASEGKWASTRDSLSPDGDKKNPKKRGAAQPDLDEESETGGGVDANSTALAFSSQEFGLHRWKEYAVLR